MLKLHQKFFLEKMKLTVKQMSRTELEDYIIQLHQLMFGKDNAYADLMFNWGKERNNG